MTAVKESQQTGQVDWVDEEELEEEDEDLDEVTALVFIDSIVLHGWVICLRRHFFC